jgi:hypothetical protein
MDIPDRMTYPDHLMFRHTPLDQGKTSIRLVRVLPWLSDTLLIRCEVIHAVIPPSYKYNGIGNLLRPASATDIECPPYLCLSYTWGDPLDNGCTIKLNGKVFKVRENLWTFLHTAREKFNDTYLWIDALCKSSFVLKRLTSHAIRAKLIS